MGSRSGSLLHGKCRLIFYLIREFMLLPPETAFTDKFIDQDTANQIRRAIEMTKVAMIFEEEKRQAVAEAIAETTAQVTEQVTEQVTKRVTKRVTRQVAKQTWQQAAEEYALRMLQRGYPVEEVASLLPDYPREKIEKLKDRLVPGQPGGQN